LLYIFVDSNVITFEHYSCVIEPTKNRGKTAVASRERSRIARWRRCPALRPKLPISQPGGEAALTKTTQRNKSPQPTRRTLRGSGRPLGHPAPSQSTGPHFIAGRIMTAPQVLPRKPNALEAFFPVRKPIIGVIHLKALPGAPRYDGQSVREIYAAAAVDARTLADGGVNGVIVENASDMPFARPENIGPETVAALTAACLEVRSAVDIPIGITCVANGVIPALAIAKAVGAKWVRANQWVNAYVANEGFLNGPAPEAMRYRSAIGARDVAIFADVHVKFGAHAITADRSIAEQATDAEWFDADVLIASGTRTGSPTQPREVEDVRAGTNLPVIVGSGLAPEQVPELFAVADGAIIGQWLKHDGRWWNPVDPRRVERLMSAVSAVRSA
jgi:membrane complex biogenesis BtpA family protein